MNQINYREVFKKNPEEYEKITQSKYIRLIFDLEVDVLNNFFDKIESENKSALDFACGSGRWTQYVETKFKNVLGVDVSEEMLDKAKQKCKSAKFVLADITKQESTSQITDKFDIITSFRFYKNAEQELREDATKNLVKYLKSDGYFIFDLHLNTWSVMGILANFIKLLKIDKIFNIKNLTVRTVSLNDIKKILKENGFKVVDYYGMGVLPGRSNYLILPKNLLYKIEHYFTIKKIMRYFSYNLLVIAKKN